MTGFFWKVPQDPGLVLYTDLEKSRHLAVDFRKDAAIQLRSGWDAVSITGRLSLVILAEQFKEECDEESRSGRSRHTPADIP